MYVCIWVVIVVFVLGGGGGGGGVFSHLSIKLFCTATEITFIYLFIFESCASSRSASKRMNKLTICRTMLRVHHIFFPARFLCHNKFFGRFCVRCVLCDCRIYVLLHITLLFVCVYASMHFTLSLLLCQLSISTKRGNVSLSLLFQENFIQFATVSARLLF